MAGVTVTRHAFLQDRQGRTLADVLKDPAQPFDEMLAFFNDKNRQLRMEGPGTYHDRTPLVGIVREFEAQPLIDSFLSSKHPRRTKRFRQAVGVLVSMIVELLRWQKTGKEDSSGVRTTLPPRTATPACPEGQCGIRDQRFRGRLSIRSKTMNTFRVWIRPLGNDCRVRVDGMQNARWLLDRLSQSFVFKSSESIIDDEASSCSTFRVPYSSQNPRSRFEKMLAAIPGVKLMLDPA